MTAQTAAAPRTRSRPAVLAELGRDPSSWPSVGTAVAVRRDLEFFDGGRCLDGRWLFAPAFALGAGRGGPAAIGHASRAHAGPGRDFGVGLDPASFCASPCQWQTLGCS